MVKCEDLSSGAKAAAQYEESIYAQGPVSLHGFDNAPDGLAGAAPGTVLKVEEYTNTAHYNLPPPELCPASSTRVGPYKARPCQHRHSSFGLTKLARNPMEVAPW